MSERAIIVRTIGGLFGLLCVTGLVVAGAFGGMHPGVAHDPLVTFILAGIGFVGAFLLMFSLIRSGWPGAIVLINLAVGGAIWDFIVGDGFGAMSLVWVGLAVAGSIGMPRS